MSAIKVVFVGQGPNRASWERGLAKGRFFRPMNPEGFAEELGMRISLTGKVGERLAAVAGMTPAAFYRAHPRANLNRRFLGKQGKGDKFDRHEARLRAAELLARHPGARFVLLGANVARAFGVKKWAPLCHVSETLESPIRFLLFPHPSGISLWWNSAENRREAERVLRRFLR